MSNIVSFKYNKDNFDEIKKYNFGRNWPVVYVLENKKEIYIGQTVNAYYRSKQHYEKSERRKLTEIHIITDEEFNVSAALDIESWLIQYVSADGKYVLQNGNGGLKNHNYYDRVKYRTKFEMTWEKLREFGIAHNTLIDLENSDLFKYSPYKSLTDDQQIIAKQIFEDLKKNENTTFIINGGAGTGKTILATYLFKFLKEKEETKHLSMAFVVPMTQLRRSIKKVFAKTKGLSSGMVIGPSEVIGKNYDLVIVDESHRLHRPVNITNLGSHYNNNEQLGLPKREGTELDWILKESKRQIFFYDINQAVGPSCVKQEDFGSIKARNLFLTEQKRVEAGEDYVEFITEFFNLKTPTNKNFGKYDFVIYDDIHKLFSDIKEKDKEHGLSRVVAGYAWPWHSKPGNATRVQEYDIEIDGYKAVWNSTVQDWMNSPNAINEVGCIHTVQGYGLNYTGVIIGPEFGYDPERKRFFVDKKKYFDKNGRNGITDPDELERYIINIYKILLTRGIKGTYVYVCDKNLREYLREHMYTNEGASLIKNNEGIDSPYVGTMIPVPMFESVGCGELLFADSNVQEMISVREDYISRGSKYFILRASGDSMNKAGIHDGDLVLCLKNYNPPERSNVVALIGEDATIKEYYRENGIVILKPNSDNSTHKSLKYKTNDEIKIQGIVVRVLKEGDYDDIVS